jgi:hypothetical protein
MCSSLILLIHCAVSLELADGLIKNLCRCMCGFSRDVSYLLLSLKVNFKFLMEC